MTYFDFFRVTVFDELPLVHSTGCDPYFFPLLALLFTGTSISSCTMSSENTSSFLGFHNWDQERSHMSRTCSLVLSLSTLVPVLPGNRTRPPTCQSTFLLSTSQFRRRYPVSRYWPQFFLQHYHHISNYHSLLSSLHIFHILVPCATQK
jgi:hypothetical protein